MHIGLSAVQPGTGAVLAMYGGPEAGQLNQATQAKIQPGSSFKPFALTAALEDGVSLRSRFEGNSPLELPGTDKEVGNEFDNDYGSSVDLVTATRESINTAFVDLTLEIGPGRVLDAAVAAGIPEDTPGLEANAVIPLGTASVRNIDMANAYATFAAGGEAAQWHVVKEVKGANGGTQVQGRHDSIARLRRGRGRRRELRAAAGRARRHRREGAGAGPPGRRQDRHGGVAARHDHVVVVRRLHAAAVGGGEHLQGHRAGPTSTGWAGCSTFFGGEYPARIWTAFMEGAMKGDGRRVLPGPGVRRRGRQPGAHRATPTPTETPDRVTDADRVADADGVRSCPPSRRPTNTPPGQTNRTEPDRHDRRRAPVDRPVAGRRRPVPRRPRRPARQRGGRRSARPSRAAGWRMVDACPGAAGADVPDLRGGAAAEGVLPRHRLGRTGQLRRTPATATSPRCTTAAVSPTARCPTSARRATGRSSTPC